MRNSFGALMPLPWTLRLLKHHLWGPTAQLPASGTILQGGCFCDCAHLIPGIGKNSWELIWVKEQASLGRLTKELAGRGEEQDPGPLLIPCWTHSVGLRPERDPAPRFPPLTGQGVGLAWMAGGQADL